MLQRVFLVGCVALCSVAVVGCGSGDRVKVENIEVSANNDPLNEPRSILKRYAEGQQLGSEVTTFEYMVNKVRETDPTRADVLEKGFKELQEAAPPARPAKAKELLEKIQPSMT